jgi:hypothetical protein
VSVSQCAREVEVVEAVFTGRWPAVDEELLMHADTCDLCRDVACVAPLLHDDGAAMRHHVQVPAAGQVWWRAAVRARMEAAHAAARPVTWFQALAGAAGVGLLIALVGFAWPTVTASLTWIGGAAVQLDPNGTETAVALAPLLERLMPFIVAVGLCAVLAPVAVLIALSDD